MDPTTQTSLAAASEVALSGRTVASTARPLLVAPTLTGKEFNTIRSAVVPLACFKLEDVAFDFDSSFFMPRVRPAMGDLKALLNEHPSCPASIFGHADPVGNDDYNKGLSGRRAQAFYALLTRRVDLWEDLHGQESKAWGHRAVQIMLDALGFVPGRTDGTLDQPTKDAITQFQAQNGLAADGVDGPATRKKLYLGYMDFLCVDQAGAKYQLAKTDFLGRGADSAGHADFQGCSEFNPVLLFSKEEKDEFDRGADKTDRDKQNEPNRRVMVLLFPPETAIDVAQWPCPRVKEGTGGCRKRFWSDGDKRRQNSDVRREFKDTSDTFACRFYQRLTDSTPCERFGKLDFGKIFVELFDGDGKELLTNRKYTIESASGLNMKLQGVTNDKGRLRHENVPPGKWVLNLEAVHETSIVHVLSSDDAKPQVRCLDNPRLRIIVTTPDDEPVEGATVDVSELGRKEQTDADGVADFGTVTPGDFTFRVSKKGFTAPDAVARLGLVTAPGDRGDRVGDSPGAAGKVTVKDTKETGKAGLVPAAGAVVSITGIQPGTASLRNETQKLEDSDPMTSRSADKDLSNSKNPPFVLIRGSDSLKLVAETKPPGQRVTWAVEPNNSNPGPLPGILTKSDGSANLSTDATGPFAVTATIGKAQIVWNVVFVSVHVLVDTTKVVDHLDGKTFEDNNSNPADVGIRSGKFDITKVDEFAFAVTVDVALRAGPKPNPDWFKEVALFYLQNGIGSDVRAEYSGSSQLRERFKDPKMKFPVVDSNGKTADYFGPLTPTEAPFTIAAVQTRFLRDDPELKVMLFGDSPEERFATHFNDQDIVRIRGKLFFSLAITSLARISRNCVVAHAELRWTADYGGTVSGVADKKPRYTRDTAFTKIEGADRKFKLISPATAGRNAREAGFEMFAPKFTDAVTTRSN